MVNRIISLVRLSCENSIKLAKAINSPIIVIPVYDLISDATATPNSLFKRIKKLGGFHSALDYNGIVILSFIMRDDLIEKFKLPEQYAEIINGLKPDFYFTPDGLTYEKQDNKSFFEIIRILLLTAQLIKLCPNITPIGLVKGANETQIKAHRDSLKKLGINKFVFHTGDFFRNGSPDMIQRAKYYCSIIKRDGNPLMLYGFGSPKLMLEFSFVDYFITYTHFVNAKHRKSFVGTEKEKYSNKPVYELALHNFKELSNHLKKLRYQTKLFIGGKCKWEGELQDQEPQLVVQSQKVKN